MLKISTTTGFFRNAIQIDTVTELISKPKSIYVFGCSEGCEAYSLAIHYYNKFNYIDYKLTGYDINANCIDVASKGTYDINQIDYYKSENLAIDGALKCLNKTKSGAYQVIDEIHRVCHFKFGNILDTDFMANLEPSDVILCQNVLIHLPYKQNVVAMTNLSKLLKSGSILVIGGMRPSYRSKITKKLKLKPIENNCETIHNNWLDCRKMWDEGNVLTRDYFALEPFKETKDWPYRYSTIFKK